MADSGQLPLAVPEPGLPLPAEGRFPRPDGRPSKPPPLSDTARIVASDAAEKDRALERRLVSILSNLEYCRAQIAEEQPRPQPGEILPVLTAMAEQVVDGAENRLRDRADQEALTRALAKADAFKGAVRDLAAEFGGLSVWKAIARLFGKSRSTEEDRRRRFRQATGSLVDVLDSFFALYKSAFHAPEAADSWAQTYTVFLADLIQVLDRLHY
jgi:hypothetical protein